MAFVEYYRIWLFYAPLSFASSYGASWLVAGTWQLTIVAGGLMSPLFFKIIKTEKGIVKIRNKIPKKSLLISLLILVGIALMYIEEATDISLLNTMLVIIPVIIAAFSYPLGNRKMMEICDSNINTIQRVFGMTLCSIPFWIIISTFRNFKFWTSRKKSVNTIIHSSCLFWNNCNYIIF